MNEQDGFRLEAAEQVGFVAVDPGAGAFDGAYTCTVVQLIAFTKACERKGRAEAMQCVRRELNNPLNAQAQSPLLAVLGALKKRNDETDAELAPILEAERVRANAMRQPIPTACADCQHTGYCHAFDKCQLTGNALNRVQP